MFSLIAERFARGCSHSDIHAMFGGARHKVEAGGTPASPATLAGYVR